ncbi:Transcriptional regulator STERILE APETALA [Sesamum alatum]|uniref:Transcriptional regulator STERILE APETALA n=1 Tax=Sesamum alatum TaxID=300844 RepID=A0AAE1YK74_9LAMI|nr:Transcriptional regulator STERILE APETALA [Sesamum alatum]
MSSSSSSSTPVEEVQGGDGGGGGGGVEEPSSSRSRTTWGNVVWPAPFLEALAVQVTADASANLGRLAAAPVLFNIFQVCSTWRAISRSELLWQNLTRRVWNVTYLTRDTWREEYIYHHRTARNFLLRRCIYSTLHFVPTVNNNNNNEDGRSCRRLALSDNNIAAGFSDGAVHLFHIPDGYHISTFYPEHRDRLGRFSSAVSGIILSDFRIVFATLDGDIHMAVIDNGDMTLRRAHLGDVVNHGALADFSGCDRWWVGLYAGVPGHAFRIWSNETEELLFVGGTLTDPQAVMGWHLLTELTDLIGRVRVTSNDTAVACNGIRVEVIDLQNEGIVLESDEPRRQLMVGLFDANDEWALVADDRGVVSVRHVEDLEEKCWFRLGGRYLRRVLGCVNSGYAVICSEGEIMVYEVEHGEYLYNFREEIGHCKALIADEKCVAACSANGTIHLWYFEAE